MNLETFKSELRADIRRLTAALAALEDTGTISASTPAQPFAQTSTAKQPVVIHQKRKLSPETRKKISKTMEANWKKRGRNRRSRELTPAVKAKIAASQKARWAKQKAAAQAVASTPAASVAA